MSLSASGTARAALWPGLSFSYRGTAAPRRRTAVASSRRVVCQLVDSQCSRCGRHLDWTLEGQAAERTTMQGLILCTEVMELLACLHIPRYRDNPAW